MSCNVYIDATVYLGNDNAVVIKPYSDYSSRTNYDMTNVTNVRADADLTTSTTSGDAVTEDYLTSPLLVFWDNTTDPDGEWLIHCKVGRFSGIAAGVYTLRVTIFDPTHTAGWVVPDTGEMLRVTVTDNP